MNPQGPIAREDTFSSWYAHLAQLFGKDASDYSLYRESVAATLRLALREEENPEARLILKSALDEVRYSTSVQSSKIIVSRTIIAVAEAHGINAREMTFRSDGTPFVKTVGAVILR